MKIKLLIILTFSLLVAFAAELAYDVLQKSDFSEMVMEKEEKGKKGDEGSEKEDAKIKVLNQLSDEESLADTRALFVLGHTYFTCSVYLALPEIPPDVI